MAVTDPWQRKSFLAEAEALLKRNALLEALDLAEARLARSPGDLDARSVVCRVRLMQGRVGESREMLAEIEEILSGISQIYACIGDLCMKRGMEESAAGFYRKFVALNPGIPLSLDVLAAKRGGGEEPAVAGAEEPGEVAAPADEIPDAFQTATLADLYLRQGHLEQAEALLVRILEREPGNEKASALLREVRGVPAGGGADAAGPNDAVIAELARWLANIGRIGTHAA